MTDQQKAREKEIHLKLNDGSVVVAHPLLHEASGTIKDFLKTSDPATKVEELPIQQGNPGAEDLEFMNKLVALLDETEVREHSDDRAFWVENISKKKEKLAPLSEGLDADTLIRRANLADFLIFHAAIHYCTYVLAERAQNMPLAEIRNMLNEVDDFDDDQRALIAEFAEIQNA